MTQILSTTNIFIPQGGDLATVTGRCTHLGIAAHQDDLEVMAFHGILAGVRDPRSCFVGILCGDGAGSSRAGPYRDLTDAEMVKVRAAEQRAAAELGRYGAVIQLGLSSAALRADPEAVAAALEPFLAAVTPQIIYLHNPFDKHPTHRAVLRASLSALHQQRQRLTKTTLYGGEVWRGLDWLPERYKVSLDVSESEGLAQRLIACFDSQVSGGKRYDLAEVGRRAANATYLNPRVGDAACSVSYAIEMSSLLATGAAGVLPFVEEVLREFEREITAGVVEFFP